MRRKSRIMLFVFLGISATVAAAILIPRPGRKQTQAEEEFRKGFVLYNEYHYDASIEQFSRSLGLSPDFHLARRMLGQAYYFSGQVDNALSEWQLLSEKDYPDLPLRNHVRNLGSYKTDLSTQYRFHRLLPQTQGYRYNKPVFLAKLPNEYVILLSLGGIETGGYLEINTNGEFNRNLHRISGKLDYPMATASGKDEIWVTDYNTDLIHRMKLKGGRPLPLVNQLKPLGGKGSGNLQFRAPAGICYHNGYFFIADSANNRIQKIAENGSHVMNFTYEENEVRLTSPFGIVCLPEGDIIVSEPSEGRLTVFDKYGNFLHHEHTNELKKPRHLFYDDNKRQLIVADEDNGVFIFNSDGSVNQHFTGRTLPDGTFQKFLRPYSAIVDSFENFYIADYAATEVLQYIPERNLVSNLEVWVEKVSVARFPSVGLYVNVKDATGKSFTNLSAENFRVFESDADVGLLRDDFLKKFEDQMTVIFVVSRSSGMKKYADTFVWSSDFILSGLREKDKISISSYTDDEREDSPYTNSRLRLVKALQAENVKDYKEQSAPGAGKALHRAITRLLSENGKKAVVWLTDGNLDPAGFNIFSLQRLEKYAKANHIPIFILSYENATIPNLQASTLKLKEFSSLTGGAYFNAFKVTDNLLKKIREIPEDRIVLSYNSKSDKTWTGRFIDLRVMTSFQGRKGLEYSGFFIPERTR